MTTIDKQTVEHVATLARLDLTEAEKERYTKDLSQILQLVEQLEKADLSAVDDSLTVDAETITREDEVVKAYDRDELLKNAPQEQFGFIRVPKILEGEQDS
ncbi:MAG: Asp-tRNA(Asn)/Glu-tRNA(Gln) amidotransferase subunit GatC [Vampirovibrio sp.]|nr:Asp-tRNA(Asn)/Glu-tRNA(Gln) amidotransferase subunit GatC [Vampirovibrio sp.]